MKKMLFSLFLLVGVNSFAVLPPFYHSSREIKAILDDSKVHDVLSSGQLILSIVKQDDVYLVTTPDYKMQVRVVYKETKIIDSSEFDVVIDWVEKIS